MYSTFSNTEFTTKNINLSEKRLFSLKNIYETLESFWGLQYLWKIRELLGCNICSYVVLQLLNKEAIVYNPGFIIDTESKLKMSQLAKYFLKLS